MHKVALIKREIVVTSAVGLDPDLGEAELLALGDWLDDKPGRVGVRSAWHSRRQYRFRID